MITGTDIIYALNDAIVSFAPEATVYLQFCPMDFERPSYFVWREKTSIQRVNTGLIFVDSTYVVTSFCTIDERGESARGDILSAMDDLSSVFYRGYISVGDRAIKYDTYTAAEDFDRATIELRFSYYESDEQRSTGPLIEDVIVDGELN